MLTMWTFIFCLGVVAVSEAFVDFDKSRLFDETDFAVGTVYVPNYCSEGCRIYASMPPESNDVAHRINLIDFEAVVVTISLLQVSRIEGEGGKKGYYQVAKGNAQVNFVNTNTNHKTAPIVVWIVRNDAPNIETAEVYDAAATHRGPATINGSITVLSAKPYVLQTDTHDGDMAVRAIAAGFDAFDSIDHCTPIMEMNDPTSYRDIRVWIRFPLITIAFPFDTYPDTLIGMHASDGNIDHFNLDMSAFVTSPGYIGCEIKENTISGKPTSTYFSSLYKDLPNYRLVAPEEMDVTLTGDVNTDSLHAVKLVSEEAEVEQWFGSKADGTNAKNTTLTTKDLIISWSIDDTTLDQSFLIKIDLSGDTSETTTVETAQNLTTTDESEQDGTSAYATDSEAVQTTTLETEWSTSEETIERSTTLDVSKTTTADSESTTEKPETTKRPTTAYHPRITTPVKHTTTSFHPTSTVSSSIKSTISSTTISPTTSGTRFGASLLATILISIVIIR